MWVHFILTGYNDDCIPISRSSPAFCNQPACGETPVIYDFNDYALTDEWLGSEEWTTTQNGGYFRVSQTDSFDGSNYIRFQNSGPSGAFGLALFRRVRAKSAASADPR